MIILTGGAGFIGANMLMALNKMGERDILIVDNINSSEKWKNLVGKKFREYIHKDMLWSWLENNHDVQVTFVIHLGACTNTMETDFDYLYSNNVTFSQKIWQFCSDREIPLIYASSAATYGDGSLGFSDDESIITKFKPINQYGYSKHLFDLWVLKQKSYPLRWYGLKYFNVYGPWEAHKGSMASTAYQKIHEALDSGIIRLFKSYLKEYDHGEQSRDFVFVSDIVDIMKHFFLSSSASSGIYNAGTGISRSFNDLANSIFLAINKSAQITYFDMPVELRKCYQYFTESDMSKYLLANNNYKPVSLDEGIERYIEWFLSLKIKNN